MGLNVIFAGTPEFAAEHLKAVLDSNHTVAAVYSQPDRPSGRGRKLTPSPVKQVALDAGLPVFQPASFKEEGALGQLAYFKADLMIVVAYGLLLPQAVLDTPRLGCINVHASLLPRWRGAAPIHRALLAGDEKTGVTVMQMDAGLDTGAMLLKAGCVIDPRETSASLHDKLVDLGRPALVEALDRLEAGLLTPEPQDADQATYAHKLSKTEGSIDWQQSAADIDRKIRGLTPWPGAYTQWQGDTLRIHAGEALDQAARKAPGEIESLGPDHLWVACGEGILAIRRLQMPGKKAMPIADILNARRQAFEQYPVLGQGTETAQ